MLLETRRTCLFETCPACSAKVFRCVLKGSYEFDEFGTTAAIKVHDRCEECKEVIAETSVALDIGGIDDHIQDFFDLWEQRRIADEYFAFAIQSLFEGVGGWIRNPQQKFG